jgi:Carboxypeptidase regulatory-like domain
VRRWLLQREPILLLAIFLCLAASAHAWQESPPQNAAGIAGTLTDADGRAIVGAEVKLHLKDSNTDKVTTTDSDGHFEFSGIAPQHVDISIKAAGFGASTASAVLQPSQTLELDPIKLSAATNLSVDVSSRAQEEIAEQQIRVEEHQRLGGVMPNFYVSYTWQAAPLTAKQKYKLAWKTTIDPVSFLIVGGTAGIEQAQDHFEEYGEGALGYAKRYGANYADLAIGTFVGGAVLPALFHQDPRYFYKGTGSFWSRAGYALSTAVICRGDNGRWQANYSGVLGDLVAGAASNLYYPANDRTGVSLTIENGFLSAVFDGVGNLLQEFVFHHFTTGKPKPPSTPSNP